jgi:hypothetical protein
MAARVALTASIAFLIVVVTPWGEAPVTIALAFLAGVTPMPIISAVVVTPFKVLAGRATRAKKKNKEALPPVKAAAAIESELSNRRPLTALDHVDLFESARLEGEGINDMEALAHGEIVDLLVATRTSAGRLMDWVDQALLIIHVEGPSTGGSSDARISALRRLGLRTATDVVSAAQRQGTEEVEKIFGGRAKLRIVINSITAEPNYAFVNWWKTSRLGLSTRNERLVLGADGCLHARHPMDVAETCGQLVLSDDPSGNGQPGEAGGQLVGDATR